MPAHRARVNPDSVVYALAAGSRVKIGVTRNLDKRMRELQTGCPERLVCLGTRPGGSELELALHRQFGHARVHGEWFDLNASDREELRRRLDGAPHYIKLPRAGPRQMWGFHGKRKPKRRAR